MSQTKHKHMHTYTHTMLPHAWFMRSTIIYDWVSSSLIKVTIKLRIYNTSTLLSRTTHPQEAHRASDGKSAPSQ